MFSILAKRHSPIHLFAFEATFIKTSNPILCRQKEFIYSLKNLHVSAVFVTATYSFAVMPISFSANHRLAPINTWAFSVLSILAIFIEKCQTKSFEGNKYSTQNN